MKNKDLVERQIKEAIEKGDFDNLSGKGKPLKLKNENPLLPPEERMAYNMMKALGLTSVEGQIKSEMDKLKKQINECEDDKKKETLKKQYREKEIWFNILMEKRKS